LKDTTCGMKLVIIVDSTVLKLIMRSKIYRSREAAQVFFIKKGKKISVFIVFTYTVWSTILGFGKSIQSYSSFSNEPKTEIVRVVKSPLNERNCQFKNFLKIAPTIIENSDKIVLTDKQIEQFDFLGQQVIRDSITIDEKIL